MTRFLGPIPITVSDANDPQPAGHAGPERANQNRFWQGVTYLAVTLMAASVAFLALALGDELAILAQELYFFLLRSASAMTNLAAI